MFPGEDPRVVNIAGGKSYFLSNEKCQHDQSATVPDIDDVGDKSSLAITTDSLKFLLLFLEKEYA